MCLTRCMLMPLNSRASFAKDPFENHNKNYSELTPDVLSKILVDVKKTAASGESSCVFIDDCAYAYKEKAIERLLREFAFNARHLRCNLMLVSQTLRSIPNKVRLAASHILCFEPANRLEAGVLASEFIAPRAQERAKRSERSGTGGRLSGKRACVISGDNTGCTILTVTLVPLL